MLFIDPSSKKIKSAESEFLDGITLFVIERLLRLERKLTEDEWILFERQFVNLIEPELIDILIGDPIKLSLINKKIKPFLEFSPVFNNGIKEVFKYDLFATKAKKRYDAYKLAATLDIRTCPYCNRNYTTTVFKRQGNGLIRPQFDHFFDKASNPLLALSFYNLIPSCSTCNANLKGKTKFTLKDYLHPYVDNSINDIRFTYFYTSKNLGNLKIKVVSSEPSKAKNSLSAFAIEEIYNSHISELEDMLKLRRYFSSKYIEILKSTFLRKTNISDEEIYRIVFGTEYNSNSFLNRPLSKFKKDILAQLGVV